MTPKIAAIEGRSGSGKSSLAARLCQLYDCNVFHMDDFFLPPEMKTAARLEEIGGNVDYARFNEQVIENLKKGKPFAYDIYDCKTGCFRSSGEIPVKPLNIVEGVYSLHPLYRDCYDVTLFLDIDDSSQADRLLKRCGEFLYERYVREWIPLENAYFRAFDFENSCDIIINTAKP